MLATIVVILETHYRFYKQPHEMVLMTRWSLHICTAGKMQIADWVPIIGDDKDDFSDDNG